MLLEPTYLPGFIPYPILRIAIIFTDAGLESEDVMRVTNIVREADKKRIVVQPIFVGHDPEAIQRNREVFGKVISGSTIENLSGVVGRWLRALLSR